VFVCAVCVCVCVWLSVCCVSVRESVYVVFLSVGLCVGLFQLLCDRVCASVNLCD